MVLPHWCSCSPVARAVLPVVSESHYIQLYCEFHSIQVEKYQQATNDVSQTGTEELVEDELQVAAFSGYWSEVLAGTSRAFSIPVLSMLIPAAGLTGSW